MEAVETIFFSETIGEFGTEPNRMVDFDGGSFRRGMLGKMESSDVAYGIIKSEPHTSTTVSEAASSNRKRPQPTINKLVKD